MVIRRIDEHTLAIEEIAPVVSELLRQISVHAQMDDPAVEQRFLSPPTAGGEPEFEADWAEYVRPDLESSFAAALEVIRGDLQRLSGDTEETLELPIEHLEAWLLGLNQARLGLAARHAFTDAELESDLPEGDEARAIALFHIRFYGLLMECFLGHLRELPD